MAEKADLEEGCYNMQEISLAKGRTVESLQRQLCGLQCELNMVLKENAKLNDRLKVIAESKPVERGRTAVPFSSDKSAEGPYPDVMETQVLEYSDTTQLLEKQVVEMMMELQCMRKELISVHQERLHFERHKKMLCLDMSSPCGDPCLRQSLEQQLGELREKYKTLQDDYLGKLPELAGLRADVDQQKRIVNLCNDSKKVLQEKYNEMEKEVKKLRLQVGSQVTKEQLLQQEQELAVAKLRYKEVKAELEEVRALCDDLEAQLNDYKNRYLQAQQEVEEQRRQMDMMELENNKITEKINIEMQRVKNQFNDKLHELTPLTDALKTTQLKLQEAQHMHMLAERNNEALAKELQAYRNKTLQIANELERYRNDQALGGSKKAAMMKRLAEAGNKYAELLEENGNLRSEVLRLEEELVESEKKVHEYMHEIKELMSKIEDAREESAREVARTKERCDTIRKKMQEKTADFEHQLAQSRAIVRAAQKDREEIRQRMQSQIYNLNENFEDAQMRIRNLLSHINAIKNSCQEDLNTSSLSEPISPCSYSSNL